MTVLFGHPAGSPFSHHAALAHLEAGRLEAFCVPWVPSEVTLWMLNATPGLGSLSGRLARRRFPPLERAPLVEGRVAEWRRLALRALGRGHEGLSYQANDWLMEVMTSRCVGRAVTAVHSYEDCSLLQFRKAKSLGKACIYDMPIGYYPAWEETRRRLTLEFVDWLPATAEMPERWVRPDQKREEMELADLVLVPGTFVKSTIESHFSDKAIAIAPYAADLDFWGPRHGPRSRGPLRFIYAGQMSIRKNVPSLVEAWKRAALEDAELVLVGPWQLAESKRASLEPTIKYLPPCSSRELRDRFQDADVFVFPSMFEGYGLVLAEAMACGLPAIATTATAGPDILSPECGWLIPHGDADALLESLRWVSQHRDDLPRMGIAARRRIEQFTWVRYRREVSEAVSSFV